MTAEQLEQVYGWMDGLVGRSIDRTDPASRAKINTYLQGSGSVTATEADEEALLDFGARLYAEFQSSDSK